jgi:hypothetical protein
MSPSQCRIAGPVASGKHTQVRDLVVFWQFRDLCERSACHENNALVEPFDRLDLFEICANGIVERMGFGWVKVVGARAGIDALAPMQRPANAGSVPARRRI